MTKKIYQDGRVVIDTDPPPPAVAHVLGVLDCLARTDEEFAAVVTEFRERYARYECFSPKQMHLVQWRLSKYGVEHDPQCFRVATDSDQHAQQLRQFDDWRREKIAPYLSWNQRSRFGF